MLVGGRYGLFAGSLFDLYDVDETDSALGADLERRQARPHRAARRGGGAERRGRGHRDDGARRHRAAPRGGRRRGGDRRRGGRRAQGQAGGPQGAATARAASATRRPSTRSSRSSRPSCTTGSDAMAAADGARARRQRALSGGREMEDTIVTLRFTELGPARRALHELEGLGPRGGTSRCAAPRSSSGRARAGSTRPGRPGRRGPLPAAGRKRRHDARRARRSPRVLSARPTRASEGTAGVPPARGRARARARGDEPKPRAWGHAGRRRDRRRGRRRARTPELAALGGIVTRRPARDVYARVRAAEKAEQRGDGIERFQESLESKLP